MNDTEDRKRYDAETIMLGLLACLERNPFDQTTRRALRAHAYQARELLPPRLVKFAILALDAAEGLDYNLKAAQGASTQ